MQLSPISLAITRLGGVRFSPAALFPSGVQGVWYDPSDASTLFSDTAGTTPSPTPGGGALSVVGLMLDKSQGLALGSELVTNGDFSNGTTGWAGTNASLSVVNGRLRVTTSVSFSGAYQSITVQAGKTYLVTASIDTGGADVNVLVGNAFAQGQAGSTGAVNGNKTVTLVVRPTQSSQVLTLLTNGVTTVDWDNISVKELAGNHAISYNTTTARPELSARVNLLTYSEQFDNAAWSRDGVTISANTLATTDPLGGNTADKIEEQITSAAHVVYTSGISASAIQYNISVYVKAAERTFARLDCVTTGYTAGTTVILNLNTLATTITNYGATSGTTAQVVTVGNGWYRLVVTFTATAASYFAQIGPAIASTPSTYAGTAGSGIYAWGADLRPANIGTSVPAYQRIADQYTYDSSGFPRYLVFNGTASGMYTPASIPFATVTSDGQARRNLLNNPTQFDVTASWTPTALTVTANAIVAPDGTTTADTIAGDGTVATHWITQSQSASATGKVFSVYAKAGTNNFIQLLFAGDANPWANFDLSNGTVGSVGTSVTAAISDAGNGWYRCSASTSSASASSVFVNLVNASTAPRGQSIALSTSAYLWGAQAESGTTLTAFQNIGTDKATVFAGVRKLSGTTGVISELSADTQTNAGSFVLGSAFVSAASYDVQVRGSARNARYYETYTAPISNVLSSQMTTAAADSATAAQTRVNGAVTSGLSFLSAASTGNFGTYALNIGVRSAAATPSLYFNGYIYSLIVVGAASTAAQISSTESWINVKEGGVY